MAKEFHRQVQDAVRDEARLRAALAEADIAPMLMVLVQLTGETALMSFAFFPAAVHALLAAGADPTPADKQGKTAVTYARQYGCEPCAVTIEQAVRKRAEYGSR